mmetsp:Transcript_23431/g.48678  ORF Transcript_23431/g.48678 Transcript_23431/m.48678 type:complete len:558 (+) Transcript_23431:1-1674(+)
MATKISVYVGDGAGTRKRAGGGKGSLVLKPRGPNVGLKRAKAGHVVKKNHWDRLLHPWQRELEADKREMRKQKEEKKRRVQQLQRQVDNFFDAEMDKKLGRVDDEMEREAEAGREGMKESESEYWKEHWKKVYEEEIQGKDWELQKKQEELEKQEHLIAVAMSPKRGDVVSGMFSSLVGGEPQVEPLPRAEDDYEELKRRQMAENLDTQVEGTQEFIQKYILGGDKDTGASEGASPASIAWDRDDDEEEDEEESEEEESESEDDGPMWVPSPKRVQDDDEGEDEEEEEKEEGGGVGSSSWFKYADKIEVEDEEEESSDEDEDAGWEWKPKSAGEADKEWEEDDVKDDDGQGSDSTAVEMASDEDEDEGLIWEPPTQPKPAVSPSKSTPSSPKKQLLPPSETELRQSLDAIQTEHKRERTQLETQLSLEQQRQHNQIMQRKASKRQMVDGNPNDETGSHAGIIAREKANAIADLQRLSSTIDREKARQQEQLKARVLARKNSLVAAHRDKAEAEEAGGRGEAEDRKAEKISSHLKNRRATMEEEEKRLREQLERMMRG